jgi:hypothetical protein
MAAMVKRIATIVLSASLIFYLYHAMFFWVYETTDTYFYWGLANFLRTGYYQAPLPYFYTIPTTMEPPLYSLFLYIADFFPRADVIIHIGQILMLLVSALFLIKILEKRIGVGWSRLVGAFYLLIPGNILQVSSAMSEMLAILIFSLYLMFLKKVLTDNKDSLIGCLLITSSVMVLSRYNFIGIFACTLLFFLIKVGRHFRQYGYVIISILILFGWVYFNHSLHGNWGLSSSEGKHLYDRVVWHDRSLPDSNNAAYMHFLSLTDGIDIYKPWWEVEHVIYPKLGNREAAVSALLKEISIAGILRHPFVYAVNTVSLFITEHAGGMPVPDLLYVGGRWLGAGCRTLGNITFCKPIVSLSSAPYVWDRIVDVTEWYYYAIPKIANVLFLLSGLVVLFRTKNHFARTCVFLYIVGALIPVMAEVPTARYLFPLYILKIIIVIESLIIIKNMVVRHNENNNVLSK